MSIRKKGNKLTQEHKNNIRNSLIGKKQSQEHIKIKNAAMKGHSVSENCRKILREKSRAYQTGRKLSIENYNKRYAWVDFDLINDLRNKGKNKKEIYETLGITKSQYKQVIRYEKIKLSHEYDKNI